ncbi:ribonuclease PH [Lujinxingia litoralis]|uniref:Ribonuclease PH n=1 Tax=Lujinxingia litoralis TaxID=2211119 RepID=A0A328C486_9DELT|nr:ribonuclease PH [Lujinxingia litoralis]RAL22131.1 ribonuclease PH [Lujinxingia litoralis]
MTARSDGRAVDELRPVSIQPHFTEMPAASVLVRFGRTTVMCTASVDERVPRWMDRPGNTRGWVTGEYSMLPGATSPRFRREVSRGGLSGRTQEIQRLIGRSLRAVTDLEKLGPRTVYLDCDVLQADGGTRTASITGAYVALALACDTLLEEGVIAALPLTDSVAAISCGMLEGRALLDLPYVEDAAADVDLNVVMTGSGRLIEVQGTGEEATFTRAELNALLDLAEKGIGELSTLQQEALPDRLHFK